MLLYDLVAEEWSDLPPMMTARFGLGLGMAQGRSGMSEMVVAGGPGQASTEIFNFQSQEWRY